MTESKSAHRKSFVRDQLTFCSKEPENLHPRVESIAFL